MFKDAMKIANELHALQIAVTAGYVAESVGKAEIARLTAELKKYI